MHNITKTVFMKNIFLLAAIIIGLQASAQEKFRVSFDDGTIQDFPVSWIQNIACLVEKEHNVVGDWVSIDPNNGKYHNFSLEENGNGTWNYTNDRNGITSEPVTYKYDKEVLTITRQGIELPYSVSWKSDYCFEITNGTFVNPFYHVYDKAETRMGEDPISIGSEGSEILYVDNNFIGMKDNKIYAKKMGTGYAIVQDKNLQEPVAYRVKVTHGTIVPIHFEEYFKKSEQEIANLFGNPFYQSESNDKYVKTYLVNQEVSMLIVSFSKEKEVVTSLISHLADEESLHAYTEDIEKRYILLSSLSNNTTKVYCDAEKLSAAKIVIRIYSEDMSIHYTDREK